MKKGTTGEARAHIDAPPQAVYDVVTDVARTGEWSPECVRCEWIKGATAPEIGARFRGRNRHGLVRWSTTSRVVAATRGERFAFIVSDPLGHDNARWDYRLEPDGDGTAVTERFEMLQDTPLYIGLFYRLGLRLRDREADLRANIQRSLAALKAAVERGAPARHPSP